MIRFEVKSLGDGTFVGTCAAYPYLEAIEDSFPAALESIQDLVERELDGSTQWLTYDF